MFSGLFRSALAVTALALMLPQAVNAQAYPSRPIKMVVPFSPGGASDILARVVAQKMTESMGQSVVVENRPGGSGIIGTEAVARSQPDGYTLLFGTISTLAVNPNIFSKLPYDPLTSFAPITLAADVPLVLVANSTVPVKNVEELIKYSKSEAGSSISYASGGNGTSQHLAAELFKSLAHVDWLHVPYKGSAPGMMDLVSGQVNVMFDNINTAMPHIKADKLRALAISSARRSALMPELPTVAEAGLPEFEVSTWFAFLAPAGTPAEIVSRLNTEMVKALANADVKEKLSVQGLTTIGSTPGQLAVYIQKEIEKWGRVIKAAGIKTD
ncbi:Bug family tripartite tricarboxylate transporter substrate binding protein [Pollutimonas bauzanensis]|uniref:Tripartite-type tricarboxylate transporter, receptor component TctC n=1 Tax=Pollutimonas bauzanensis TaxID=658167 RepID=A0A1M5SIM5_9BURK|nr:tripartite tricarboxylate transporter substrate binding protein [Pollutimonas bauzanensis]SHH38442.1 Tripartite-type tricarboxylate transporter, receptor component TctC [Pollutimonas bauzanensis]